MTLKSWLAHVYVSHWKKLLTGCGNDLAEVIAEGQAHDDFDTDLDVNDVAATVASVVQGGYVLSKAANSDEPFHSAIRGMLSILDSRRKKVSG